MKIHRLLITCLVVAAFLGCTKEAVQPQTANTTGTLKGATGSNTPTPTDASNAILKSLLGKWSLVKDSTTNSVHQFANTPTNIHQYMGTASDYYDFRIDGKCYISQNGVNDTLGYRAVNNGIVFENTGVNSTVDPLTSHSATISVGKIQGPGAFIYTETVYLKR